MFINEDKINFKLIEMSGMKTALYGMRMPMKSYDKADSFPIYGVDYKYYIGEKDMDLAKRLIKAGSEHCKFLRQIYVGFEAYLPRYIWSEFDTYGFCPKNSESTMHKLLTKNKEITLDEFVYDVRDENEIKIIIDKLNKLRELYFNTELDNKNEILRRAKAILPEGYLQKRTVSTNYAQLRNMYHQRKNHRMPEWNDKFAKFIETLSYAKEFIIE